MTRQERKPARRGVLLLVVLGMLALFTLIAVTFAIIAGQFHRTAESNQKMALEDDPEADLNEAFHQAVRGVSSESSSVLWPHSLLEDLYGADTMSGTVTAAQAAVTSGQFVAIEAPAGETVASKIRRVGCVLTMTSGPAANQSTRIVGYNPSTDRFNVMAFDGQTINGAAVMVNRQVLTGAYVVNGIPFSGGGFGVDRSGNFNAAAGRDSDGMNYALRPNPTTPDGGFRNYMTPGNVPDAANEDYDAPDYQNMLLAMVVPVDTNGDGVPDRMAVPIPSAHRPELVRYWLTRVVKDPSNVPGFAGLSWPTTTPPWTDLRKWQAVLQPYGQDGIPGTSDDPLPPQKMDNPATPQNEGVADPMANQIVALKRKIMLRPLTEDNPNFNGNNFYSWPDYSAQTDANYLSANFWELVGPWDVDNDGDGKQDSVWLDLGSPVRTARDGRQYKPLYAILCVDLDGRLNLNVHGSTAQLAGGYSQQAVGPYAGTANGLTGQLTLPRGEGYGAADVLPSAMIPAAQVKNLLQGNGTSMEGRYGEGTLGAAEAGVTNQVDALSLIKHFEFPADYSNITTGLTSFGNPPDLWGRGTVALDFLGQPYYWRHAWTSEVLNSPYRLNLAPDVVRPGSVWGTSTDNPFTPAELEGLLRRFDADAATLAGRLEKLAPSLGPLRHEVTTDSYDLPVPGTSLGFSNGRGKHASDLLREKLIQGGVPQGQLNAEISKLLAWEVLTNRRMDLNRALGNGRDSNGNNVVDESEEAAAEAGWNPPYGSPVTFNVGNGTVNSDMARQAYARHLFILAMLLLDIDGDGNQYVMPTTANTDDANLTPDQQRELTVRRIAQWAVNVVDFRDADSVMTPFEFTLNPFSGWNIDGDISTDETTLPPADPNYNPGRRVVWGCESPELVLSETLALHDRRVADTAWDPSKKKRTDDNNNDGVPDDATLDQPRIPQGSAFFELYCPRSKNNSVAPADLYTYNSNTGTWYLDLARLAPADGGGLQYPVWRMAITESRVKSANNDVAARLTQRPDSTSLDPNRPNLLSGVGGPAIPLERIVWFANQAPNGHTGEDRIYYNRTNNTLLARGQYAVVGPRLVTAIGAQNDPTTLGKPSPQRISLNPVNINGAATAYPAIGTDIQSPLPIVAAGPQPNGWTQHPDGIGISISEPLFSSANYYPEPTMANTVKLPGMTAAELDAYGDLTQQDNTKYFLPTPLDSQAGHPLADESLLTTGTTPNYKTVLLQRLADPLKPHDPVTNPYLTVDWMPIDLTVFNGEDRKPSTLPNWFKEQWDPDDADPDATLGVRFRARQRGRNPDGTPAIQTLPNSVCANLWQQSLPNAADPDKDLEKTAPDGNLTTLNFRHRLDTCTLGYVNQWYGSPWSADQNKNSPAAPAGYVGAPFDAAGNRPVQFPWLTWNNRPYATPMELMLVPTSPPGRLLWEFSLANTTIDPYDTTAAKGFSLPFGHLANFFHSADPSAGTPPGTASPNLFHIFDYVEVPSRFVGTETVLDPSVFGVQPGGQLYRPPFNMVSWYRDPGRVNINTINSPRIWAALLNGRTSPTFDLLAASRRGYVLPSQPLDPDNGNWWQTDANYPSRFANPFRSLGGSKMVPAIDPSGTIRLDHARPVNSTLLRANGPTPDTANEPLFAKNSTSAHDQTQCNAYFRYQDLARLSNLVTTRSNVYAVWVTVGYFEVEPNPSGVDLVHPDGYRLSREMGIDTGEIKRHRGFFIFDRSIPVGFQRGSDLNVEKAVLVKRFIE